MATYENPTTEEAFALLLNSKEYWAKTGESAQIRHNYRHLIKAGKGVTQDKKEELLGKAGFTVAKETLWSFPPLPSTKTISTKTDCVNKSIE